jgi:hypothetical protein
VAGETKYDNSIFQVSPPFIFSGNTLRSTAAERRVATLATAPSKLIITPPVSLNYNNDYVTNVNSIYHNYIVLLIYQNVTAAPGETVIFLVMAIDQAGNPQEATWSVTQNSENEEGSVSDVS